LSTLPRLLPSTVAANNLTGRWCAAAGEGSFVASGAGLWPLLALLASAADGRAREELVAASGCPAQAGQRAAIELVATLERAAATSAAIGLWVRDGLPLHEAWTRGLPAGVIDRLAGQGALDAWAAEHTAGLIERFPLRIDPKDVLVLATALAAKTSWVERFTAVTLTPESGPWRGHSGPGLFRSTANLDAFSIVGTGSAVVSRMVVRGVDDLDVHLVVGDGGPSGVLGTGLAALAGELPVRPGSGLAPGALAPGLRVHESESSERGDRVHLSLPPFDIRSAHDLCATPDLFGIRTAMDPTRGHFPQLSAVPLAISQGAQDVLATFSAEGFEAAAVTAFAMRVAGAMPMRRKRVRIVRVTFDRPFGFIGVHRPSGLAIVAGWVAEP